MERRNDRHRGTERPEGRKLNRNNRYEKKVTWTGIRVKGVVKQKNRHERQVKRQYDRQIDKQKREKEKQEESDDGRVEERKLLRQNENSLFHIAKLSK